MVLNKTKPIAAALALTVVGITCVFCTRARAQQDDRYQWLSGAIVGPTAVYTALPAEYLCSAFNKIGTSPDGKDVVILHHINPTPHTFETAFQDPEERHAKELNGGAFKASQLLLFSDGDDHAQVVWRGGMSRDTGFVLPEVPRWLPGTRLALLQVYTMPGPLPKSMLSAEPEEQAASDRPPITQSLLLLNTATGKVQVIAANLNLMDFVILSKTDPVAAMVHVDSKMVNGSLQRVNADGKLSATLPLTKPVGMKRLPYWRSFQPDARTLMGTVFELGKDGQPNRDIPYELDTVTGVITESAPGKVAPGVAAPKTTDVNVPYTVQRDKQTIVREGVTTTIYPLWLESRDKQFTGRTLIAADSDATFTPIILQSSVLYQHRGGIYAVPVLKASTSEFLAAQRNVQKRETLYRASQISVGMLRYARDNDDNFPMVSGDIARIIGPYVKNDALFLNPVTGKNGFTPLYKTTRLSSYDSPATTPLATLSGPGGFAVTYVDGHVKWKDDESGNP